MPSPPNARRFATAMVIAAATDACLSGENVSLGRNVDAGAAGLASTLDATPAQDGGPSLISAAISATTGTLCKGGCMDLVATVSGGSPPYAYSWGQGLGEGPGPKSVCPLATTTYSVVVSSSSSEQQSTASAMVTVTACDAGSGLSRPDASAPPPPSDAGPPTNAALCVSNPSFEGPTMIGTSGPPGVLPTAAPPQWRVCLGDPDVDPSVSLQPASDGSSYVGLAVGSGTFSNMSESVGTTLCAPLQAGVHYSFCIDLGVGVRGVMPVVTGPGTPSPALEMWGGKAPCNEDELLWTSTPITNADSWTKVCGSFVPSQVYPDIVLIPAQASTVVGPGIWSYVIVDHIVAGP